MGHPPVSPAVLDEDAVGDVEEEVGVAEDEDDDVEGEVPPSVGQFGAGTANEFGRATDAVAAGLRTTQHADADSAYVDGNVDPGSSR